MRKCCGMWLILAILRLKGLANAQVERSKGIYSSCIPVFLLGDKIIGLGVPDMQW